MRKELIAHEDPKSHVSELFRTLRTNVQFMNLNKKLKTLLVTSTIPGEGKSWISSNLAITFAQADKRVILVDADMRKCCLHSIFKVPPCPGLSNYLSGFNENNQDRDNLEMYLRETEVPNLYLIPAGNVPPNPSELLASSRMSTLINKLKDMCDLVIIDGTPSKLVTDSIILSRMVDSTIIVAGHNMAKKEDMQKIVRDIKNVGGNIAGVVYNKKPVSSKKASETYYYASTPIKMDPRKKQQEMEIELKRQVQRKRAEEMISRDRKPEEYQKQEDEIRKLEKNNNKVKVEKEETNNVGTKTTEMLKQLNDYLQKEKENRDNRK